MFKLKVNGEDVPLNVWKFPAGEVGVKIDVECHSFYPVGDDVVIEVYWKWEGNDDIMVLCQIVDAVKHQFPFAVAVILDVPYFPYSRQDRRCFAGEGHALKMLANIVNSLGFSRVRTKDAHSNVLEAVVDNLFNIEQHVCATHLPKHEVLIAPDNGASKKIYKLAQRTGSNVIIADKQRDNTGKIVSSVLPEVSTVYTTDKICVVDDLCDGGATFIELGKEIRKQLPNEEVNLYVTHGFFTKGVDELLKLYNNIYVHNLMNDDVKDKVTII